MPKLGRSLLSKQDFGKVLTFTTTYITQKTPSQSKGVIHRPHAICGRGTSQRLLCDSAYMERLKFSRGDGNLTLRIRF